MDIVKIITEKREEREIISFVCMALASVIFLVWVLVVQSDFYVIWKAPKKEDICQRVNKTYGVNVEPEDITDISVKRDLLGDAVYSFATNKRSPKIGEYSAVVEYHISYEVGDDTYNYIVKYSTKNKSVEIEPATE